MKNRFTERQTTQTAFLVLLVLIPLSKMDIRRRDSVSLKEGEIVFQFIIISLYSKMKIYDPHSQPTYVTYI